MFFDAFESWLYIFSLNLLLLNIPFRCFWVMVIYFLFEFVTAKYLSSCASPQYIPLIHASHRKSHFQQIGISPLMWLCHYHHCTPKIHTSVQLVVVCLQLFFSWCLINTVISFDEEVMWDSGCWIKELSKILKYFNICLWNRIHCLPIGSPQWQEPKKRWMLWTGEGEVPWNYERKHSEGILLADMSDNMSSSTCYSFSDY